MDKEFSNKLNPDSGMWYQPNTDSVQKDGGLLYLRGTIQAKDGQYKYMKVTINRYTRLDEALQKLLKAYEEFGNQIYEIEVESFESVEEYKKGENARELHGENKRALDRLNGYIGLPMQFESLNEEQLANDKLLHKVLMQQLNIEQLRDILGIEQNIAGFIGNVTIETKELYEMEFTDDIYKNIEFHYAPENLRNITINYMEQQAKKEEQTKEHLENKLQSLPDNVIE